VGRVGEIIGEKPQNYGPIGGIISRDLLYNMVTAISNYILYSWKILKVDFMYSPQKIDNNVKQCIC
jgi:hypothetical protein